MFLFSVSLSPSNINSQHSRSLKVPAKKVLLTQFDAAKPQHIGQKYDKHMELMENQITYMNLYIKPMKLLGIVGNRLGYQPMCSKPGHSWQAPPLILFYMPLAYEMHVCVLLL